MGNNERLTMTIQEFAEICGISRNLGYTLARQDRLPVPVIRFGGRRMVVPRKAVLALLENRMLTKPETEEEKRGAP